MKIIVTGGAGYIGSHTVVELIENGFTPVIIDDFRNSDKDVISRIQNITGITPICYNIDCCDEEKMDEVFSKEKPEGIIHFAAYKAVGESVEQPLKYYENNVGSLVVILKLVKKYGIKNFVFSSSCTVYGEPDVIPVTEQGIVKKANSPYGYTKQIGEQMIYDFANAYPSFNAIILRYFNPIGAHPSAQIGELPLGVPNNLVPYVTQTAAGLREMLTVHGSDYNTPDGTCIRDYIHVSDLASAHVLSLNAKKDERVLVFNVGTGKGTSVLEIINIFEKVSGQKLNYKIGPRRDGDVEAVYADASYIMSSLAWKAKYSVEDALKHSWQWQQTLS